MDKHQPWNNHSVVAPKSVGSMTTIAGSRVPSRAAGLSVAKLPTSRKVPVGVLLPSAFSSATGPSSASAAVVAKFCRPPPLENDTGTRMQAAG